MLNRSAAQIARAAVVFACLAGLLGCSGATIVQSNTMKPMAPGFSAQPASQSVTVGQAATFSVSVTGTAPFTYQWQKNNANLSNATSASYSTPPAVSGDNGAQYRLAAALRLHLDGQIAKHLGEVSIVLSFHRNYWMLGGVAGFGGGNGVRELWLQFLVNSGARAHAVLSTRRVAPFTAYDGAERNRPK